MIYAFLLVFTVRFARIRNLVSLIEAGLIVFISLLSLIISSSI